MFPNLDQADQNSGGCEPEESHKLRPWLRLEAGYELDDEFWDLSAEAELLYIRGLSYCKRNESAGSIPSKAVRRLTHKMKDDASRLVDELVISTLWVAADGDGWEVRSWTKWQTSPTDAKKAGRLGGLKSAHTRGRHNGKPNPGCPLCVADKSTVSGLPPLAPPLQGGSSTPQQTETETETETTRSVLNSRPKGSDSEPTSEQFEMVARWGPNAHEVDNVQKANPGFDVAAATRRFVDWHASTERTGLDNQRTHDEWMGLWRGWIRRDLAKFNAPVAAGYHKAPPPVEDHRTPDVDVSGKIASARTALNTSEMSTA